MSDRRRRMVTSREQDELHRRIVRDGACAGKQPPPEEDDPWFPVTGEQRTTQTRSEAARIALSEAAQRACAGCLVQKDCAEWAISTRQRDGVWGGLAEWELRAEQVRRAARRRQLDDRARAA